MTKTQFAVIASAVLLFFVLYFGCDTQPPEQKAVERSRAMALEQTDLQVLLQEAKSDLPEKEQTQVADLERRLSEVREDSNRVALLKQLSGKWYSLGEPAIAGGYAEQVAETLQTEESWSIAGTTYSICVQRSEEERVRDFCTDHAVSAFENAISLNPDNVANRVNLALLYTENPSEDNPMKGVQMLLDLNRKHPKNVSVLNSLGRLAIKTGQYERAVERLEKAVSLDPENRNAACLLSRAYQGLGEESESARYQRRCEQLNAAQQ